MFPGLDQAALTSFWVSRDLLLDIALQARKDLDPTDNLILLGVSQANVRLIVADPVLQQRYAYVSSNPPDDLRRPISVAALSRALGLPLETVRRRATRLLRARLLVGTSQGLVVPGARFDASDHNTSVAHLYTALQRAFTALSEAGVVPATDLFLPPVELPHSPVRAVARLGGDFYLRMLEPLRAACGDPMDAVIVLLLLRAHAGCWGSDGDAASFPRAALPIGPGEIARKFAGSPETVRRRLIRLTEAGLCERVGRGYVVPQYTVEQVVLPRMAAPSQMNLRRLLRQVAALADVPAAPTAEHARAWSRHPSVDT